MIFCLKLREGIPQTEFCRKASESIIHFFCNCEIVKPIWENMVNIIRNKCDINFSVSTFDMIFGIPDDKFLTYLFLCVKYYLYVCKFQNKKPNFTRLLVFIKNNRETEYFIAKKRGKLSLHFKKWRFDL
jgi:hypothetical protein